jgi:hypothetical protein
MKVNGGAALSLRHGSVAGKCGYGRWYSNFDASLISQNSL